MQSQRFSRTICFATAVALVVATISVLSPNVYSQHQKMMTFEKGQVFLIPELAAVVVQDGDNLKIQFVGPPQQLPKKFKDVDMKEGDILMMLNGKKLKTISDLEKAYEALAFDDELKFGIKRDETMVMTKFTKTDMESMPGVRMMTMSADSDGNVKEVSGGSGHGGMIKTMSIGGGDNIELIPALGLILRQEDDQIKVENVMNNCPKALSGKGMVDGCTIQKIQGKTVATAKELISVFEEIKTGAEMSLTFLSGGKTITASFPKPEFSGRIMKQGE